MGQATIDKIKQDITALTGVGGSALSAIPNIPAPTDMALDSTVAKDSVVAAQITASNTKTIHGRVHQGSGNNGSSDFDVRFFIGDRHDTPFAEDGDEGIVLPTFSIIGATITFDADTATAGLQGVSRTVSNTVIDLLGGGITQVTTLFMDSALPAGPDNTDTFTITLPSESLTLALLGRLGQQALNGGVVRSISGGISYVSGQLDDVLGDTGTISTINAVTSLLPDAGALTSLAQDSTVAKELTLTSAPSTMKDKIAGAVLNGLTVSTFQFDNTAWGPMSPDLVQTTLGGTPSADAAYAGYNLTMTSGANSGETRELDYFAYDGTFHFVTAFSNTPSTGDTFVINGSIASIAANGAQINAALAEAHIGVPVGASISADIAGVKTAVDAAALATVVGKTQIKEISVTSAANAGDVTLATITSQPCLIKSIVVYSNGVTTADLTAIAVYGGASKVITFVDSATGARANINAADKQVSWGTSDGSPVRLPASKTIVATLTGTGATAVSLVVTVEFVACVAGGTLV